MSKNHAASTIGTFIFVGAAVIPMIVLEAISFTVNALRVLVSVWASRSVVVVVVRSVVVVVVVVVVVAAVSASCIAFGPVVVVVVVVVAAAAVSASCIA